MDFTGNTALITGAAGGIGGALAARLRQLGARIAVADKDVSDVSADVHLPGDLLDTEYTDGLAVRACDALGGLDIVINNAGVITRGPVTETSDKDWSLSVGVNVDAIQQHTVAPPWPFRYSSRLCVC